MDEQLKVSLDAITASANESPNGENTQLIAAKCRGLMRGYHERWKNEKWKVHTVEQIYTSDLTNVDTGRKSRTFIAAGKIDVLGEQNLSQYVIDHKTTSEEIEDPNAPYWRQLAIEGQVTHYLLLQWLQGIKPDGAVWDVIRKPGIEPKKLAKATQASVVAHGMYCGFRVSDESRQSMTREDRETLEMYEFRLAHDCTTERPGRYFQRRTIPRLDGDILEYARELWDHGQEIIHCRNKTGESRLPPRNSGACMLYGTPCKFLGICSGYDSPSSDKWRHKEHVHSELNGEVDGFDTLTNSRVRCFQTCRRKHYYEYEIGIERNDREERESLWFGSLLHVGLEAWFTFLKGQDNDDDTIGSQQSDCWTPSGGSSQTELAF